MRKTPTHKAIPMAKAGEISHSLTYAKAIIKLIEHNGEEVNEFETATSIIRDALGAAQHFLDKAEQAANTGFYFVSEKQGGNDV
ncbi:hypothetical protein RO21_11835 [[Actinobacillus] muris]|uniref:Uncharacterized protein n=2 Tax=Muribacter muris TaxID=67855 RepID=A0A0J5P1P3_9PAST|nr:hypothetical protein RO21_11835 [[Actinobacillus] muris] [Muribacter muris]